MPARARYEGGKVAISFFFRDLYGNVAPKIAVNRDSRYPR